MDYGGFWTFPWFAQKLILACRSSSFFCFVLGFAFFTLCPVLPLKDDIRFKKRRFERISMFWRSNIHVRRFFLNDRLCGKLIFEQAASGDCFHNLVIVFRTHEVMCTILLVLRSCTHCASSPWIINTKKPPGQSLIFRKCYNILLIFRKFLPKFHAVTRT